jgi:hypothetical protein
MDRGVVLDIFDAVDVEQGDVMDQVCRSTAGVLGLDGVGVALLRSRHHLGSIGSSGGFAAVGEELQFGLGEGPALDASEHRAEVSQPDLNANGSRWIAFSREAQGAGIRAVFAGPMVVGRVGVGAMTVYERAVGPLGDALRVALAAVRDAGTELILSLQAGATPGVLAEQLRGLGSYNPEVHQATGMVSVQLGVSAEVAILRLRAHAYSTERSLGAVANDIVTRKLRLT